MEHAGHAVDVDAASGDVGCDDGLRTTLTELLECPFTLALAAVTVDRDGCDATLLELLGDTIGTALGATEHDRRAGTRHDASSHLDAISAFDGPEHVLCGVALVLGSSLFVLDRVVHVALDDHVDVAVERGREQQGLALRCTCVEQPLDLVQEAHVGHPVGFVQDDHVDLVEVHVTLVDQVRQAPRAGDGDVDAVAQCTQLVAEPDTPVEGLDGLLGVCELAQFVGDLGSEFAGRCEHQTARVVGACPTDALHQRNAEGDGLARAGRRTTAHVLARECGGKRCDLDGERGGDATVEQLAGEGGGNAEGLETVDGRCGIRRDVGNDGGCLVGVRVGRRGVDGGVHRYSRETSTPRGRGRAQWVRERVVGSTGRGDTVGWWTGRAPAPDARSARVVEAVKPQSL